MFVGNGENTNFIITEPSDMGKGGANIFIPSSDVYVRCTYETRLLQ